MKTRIALKEAQAVAQRFVEAIQDVCERAAVAGSVRRQKPTVGDIEIVCIPRHKLDLLGDPAESLLSPRLKRLEREGVLSLGKGGERYKQMVFEGYPVDLFITTLECWGVNLTIRTGPAEFSKRLMISLPSGCRCREARIHDGAVLLDTPEEEDVLELCGLGWIEPKDRQ